MRTRVRLSRSLLSLKRSAVYDRYFSPSLWGIIVTHHIMRIIACSRVRIAVFYALSFSLLIYDFNTVMDIHAEHSTKGRSTSTLEEVVHVVGSKNAPLSTSDIAMANEEAQHPPRPRPRLFIHVGPVKTGSSSIQCNLQVNPFLHESSYEYMGRRENVCVPTRHRLTKGGRFTNLRAFVFQYILRGWLKQDQFQDYVEEFKQLTGPKQPRESIQ